MTRGGQVFTTLQPGSPLPPPLPASAVEYWWGDRGASAAKAQGLIRGLGLPSAGSRPMVGPDPGFFAGRSVYQAAAALNNKWWSSSLAAFLATGMRPWIYVVGRWRVTGTGVVDTLCGLGTSTRNIMSVQHNLSNGRQVANFGQGTVLNGTPDTAVHRMKAWTLTNTLYFEVDGVQTNGSGATALTEDVTIAALGCMGSGGNASCDCDVAFYLVCSARPTAAEEAALDGWACTYYRLTMKAPVPANTTEFWQGEYGASVTKAIGQKNGYTINAQGTPAVGADGTFFNGRTVYLASESNNWVSSTGVAMWPNGSRPWVYCVARQRNYNDVFNRSHVGISDFGGFGTTQTSNGSWRWGSANGAGMNNGTQEYAVHRHRLWSDNSQGYYSIDDIVVVGSPVGGVSPNSLTTVSMGCRDDNHPWTQSNVSIALLVICPARPSLQEEAALDAWASTYYGLDLKVPPLPSSVFDYWHGELGASAANAVGQVAGTAVTGQNSPTVGIDTGYFNERPVYQATRATGACWQAKMLVTPLDTGTRPWVFTVLRARALAADFQMLFEMGNYYVGQCDFDTRYSQLEVGSFPGLWTVTGPAIDTRVHRLKTWTVGTAAYLQVDGTLYTNPSGGGALDNLISSFGIGAGCVGGNVGDVSVAFVLICKSRPTAAEEAALDRWAMSYYGCP